ncbi:MAG: sensor histidine kinase [Anaerolineae bacterium]|nr:sensor histidine kinase [Anaerolineae bacterium]
MTIWVIWGSFLHGLVFFMLGLTVSFMHYRSRRISLARHFSWLGIFAFCEALLAWDSISAAFLPTIWSIPAFVRTAIAAVGFAFLFAFGVQVLWSDETHERFYWHLILIPNLLWAVPYSLALALVYPDWDNVIAISELLLRYGFAFPGGILAAVGLRRQSYQLLDSHVRRDIRPYLRLFEFMMGAYSLLSLILVPYSRTLIAESFQSSTVPLYLREWLWFLVGAGLTYGLTRSLTRIQGRIERWVEENERLETLAVDRNRIGRELHDGTIQSIYAAVLLLENVQTLIRRDPDRAQAQLDRVTDNLNKAIQDVRRYIFDLRSDMPDETLSSGISSLLRDFHINTLLETDLEITGTPVPIHALERRGHIFQIVREALANTAKHAQAHYVKIHLCYNEEALDLTISDDGIGMEQLLVSKGYGLRNIRERVRLLNGKLRLESAPKEGVSYHLTVPY